MVFLDEVIGVPRRTAARVVGVPEERLRRWNHVGLIQPTILETGAGKPVWTYDLEDLVQGRVVRQLEDRGIEIRIIRRVVEAVRSSVHPAPLASLQWATSEREVYVGYPEDDQWVGGKRPSQGVIAEVLDLQKIRAEARSLIRRPGDLSGKVEHRRGVLGSKEVFAGTRIPVAAVRSYFAMGALDAEVLEAFPDLSKDDLERARRRPASA